ncbi:hypothetical protein XA68_13082 [Ophiocordyceps unilateralis]|uniref:Alpha 1,4-glycosyltransferase domain-containing protein n=1 Tax=Ophiocordyceps unilateralis TaxID=268505 RepID=A0A2A9PDI5_OPHUN|nr:hypothetical protein XA68_13082 [Ophiocordyceps unilateralis]
MGPLLRICLMMSIALSLWHVFPGFLRLGDYVSQNNRFSGQRAVEQDFTPTSKELACLHGLPLSSETEETAEEWPIPNIVNFIFFQKVPASGPEGDFGFLNYLAVRSAIISLKPERVYIHYGFPAASPAWISVVSDATDVESAITNNPWIRRLRPHVELKRYNKPLDSLLRHKEHLADRIRLEILLENGGIYMDTDAYALRPFGKALTPPSPHDAVLGYEGGNRGGMCNAVIAARSNSSFIRRWLDTYENADLNHEWNYHSVIIPKQLAVNHPNEICELPPDAFFWPTWTWGDVRWMHEPLSKSEANYWRGRIQELGGSLFPNQLVYHAWSQMSRQRYLKRLTPNIIRREDTRFNLLVRRFLEDDND